MNLPQSGVARISGDADKPANRVVIAKDGSATLSRAWSVKELAAFDRIEKLHEESIRSLDRAQHIIQAAEYAKTIHELESGKRIVLPRTREHAQAMAQVAMHWLSTNGFSPNP